MPYITTCMEADKARPFAQGPNLESEAKPGFEEQIFQSIAQSTTKVVVMNSL